MDKFRTFCQTFGLHPLAAFGMIAIDWMLFGEEVATAGVGWVLSLPVGAVLAIAVMLIQKYAYKDSTGVAIGKGLMLGLLTAIPTGLPSLGTLPFAALGVVNVLKRSPQPERAELTR
jgi:hypothetical protein